MRLGQDRRLDLEEAVLVEVAPDRHRDPVAQHQVAAASAAGAGRGSGTAAASPRRPATRRRSQTAAVARR